MNASTIHEVFSRLQQQNPKPTTELVYHSPFELLIAVILSAQATDVSVNKATAKLYAVANTPQAILALGLDGLKKMFNDAIMQRVEQRFYEMFLDIKSAKDTGEISDLLRDCMMVHGHGKKQLEDSIDPHKAGYSAPAAEIPGKSALLKTPVTPWEKAKAVAKDTAKGMLGHKDVEHFGTGKPGLEEELNELAKLAGIASEGNAFTGKLAATPKGGKFELDGKEFTDTSTLDEEPNEGNAFGAAVAKAKADGVQPGEKVEVGGKEYPVKEAKSKSKDKPASFIFSSKKSSEVRCSIPRPSKILSLIKVFPEPVTPSNVWRFAPLLSEAVNSFIAFG